MVLLLAVLAYPIYQSAIVGAQVVQSFRSVRGGTLRPDEDFLSYCLSLSSEKSCCHAGCRWCGSFCVTKLLVPEGSQESDRCYEANEKAEEEKAMGVTDWREMVAGWNDLTSACLSFFDPVSCSQNQDAKTGEGCIWCDGFGVFGLCLSPDGAGKVSGYLTCESKDNVGEAGENNRVDPSDFLKCVHNTGYKSCDDTEISDGGHCTWCISPRDLQESFCATPLVAKAMKLIAPDLDCDNGPLVQNIEGDAGDHQDLLTCIQNSDEDSCDHTELSVGGHCTWCSSDSLQQRFCTTTQAGEVIKKFLRDFDCTKGSLGANERIAINSGPEDLFKCLQSTDDDACDATKMSDGGHCVWCHSDELHKDFCTTPQVAKMLNLNCDDSDVRINVDNVEEGSDVSAVEY